MNSTLVAVILFFIGARAGPTPGKKSFPRFRPDRSRTPHRPILPSFTSFPLPGTPPGGEPHIANSGRLRSNCPCSRSTMALCIWLTRLSERSSVAPISFMVSSS